MHLGDITWIPPKTSMRPSARRVAVWYARASGGLPPERTRFHAQSAPMCSSCSSGSANFRPDQPPHTRSFAPLPFAACSVAQWPMRADGLRARGACVHARTYMRAVYPLPPPPPRLMVACTDLWPRSTASYQTPNSGSYDSIVFAALPAPPVTGPLQGGGSEPGTAASPSARA